MQYDKFKDVLFIHIPRTGGQSIQQVMLDSHAGVTANTPDQMHQEYEGARIREKHSYGNDWAGSWKFTVVRNPYAIEVSKYKTRRNLLTLVGRNANNYTFENYIDSALKLRDVDFNRETTAANTTCLSSYPTCSCKFGDPTSAQYVDTGGNTDCRAIINALNTDSSAFSKDRIVWDADQAAVTKQAGRNGQIPFFTTNTGVIVANTILYYEDLENEWINKVAVPKGYSNTISYRIANSAASSDDYREYYKKNGVANTEMIQLVANNYELDIDHLHYSWHMGPDTKPTQAWSTTIDTTSYPQFVFGVGSSMLSPTQMATYSVQRAKFPQANNDPEYLSASDLRGVRYIHYVPKSANTYTRR